MDCLLIELVPTEVTGVLYISFITAPSFSHLFISAEQRKQKDKVKCKNVPKKLLRYKLKYKVHILKTCVAKPVF